MNFHVAQFSPDSFLTRENPSEPFCFIGGRLTIRESIGQNRLKTLIEKGLQYTGGRLQKHWQHSRGISLRDDRTTG